MSSLSVACWSVRSRLRRTAAVLAVLMAALVANLSGADTAISLAWPEAPAPTLPAAWHSSGAPDAHIRVLADACEFQTAPTQDSWLSMNPALVDGSDAQPLQLTANIAAAGPAALAQAPALLVLEWSSGAVFSLGLTDDPQDKNTDARYVLARWHNDTTSGETISAAAFAPSASPTQVRIVVTSRQVTALASRDGWNWRRIAGVSRADFAASGVPLRIRIGHGAGPAPAGKIAENPEEKPEASATYRFTSLRCSHNPALVPADYLGAYVHHDSLLDTLPANEPSMVARSWRLLGPQEAPATMPVTLADHFHSEGVWNAYEIPADQTTVPIGKSLPGGGDLVRWASTTITAAASGWQQFQFDGTRRCWAWLDGTLISAPDRDQPNLDPQHQVITAWMQAGAHTMTLALRGAGEESQLVLRSQPGDPRHRIAMLRRLLLDFPGDEGLTEAPFEISGLWEGLGFQEQAAKELTELAQDDNRSRAERALAEQVRLFHQLGDAARAQEATAALQKLWQNYAVDAASAVRRTARLWLSLDDPERALAEYDQALAQAEVTPELRRALLMDRARLRAKITAPDPNPPQRAGLIAADVRAAGETFPPENPLQFALLAEAAIRDPAPARAQLEALHKLAGTDAERLRVLAGIFAAHDDAAGRNAIRRAVAKLPSSGLLTPIVELAEDYAAANDAKSATALYAVALSNRGVAKIDSLAAARVALFRAVLSETLAGKNLLSAADHVTPAAQKDLAWKVCGPFPVGDWTAHESPAFEVARGAEAGPIADKPWRDAPLSGSGSGFLDMNQVGGGDQVLYYLSTTFESAEAGNTTATFGADDGLSLWLNGQRIYSDRTQRGLAPDSIAVVLPLRAGQNVLVASVENGNGGFGFQYRLRRPPWPGMDIASAASASADDRAKAAGILAQTAQTLLSIGQRDEAWALARTTIMCFPEQLKTVRDLAGSVISQPAWQLNNPQLLAIIAWFDAAVADRRRDEVDTVQWLRDHVPGLLTGAGLNEEAFVRVQREAMVSLDAGIVATACLREADIWSAMGSPARANEALDRARESVTDDDGIRHEIDNRRAAWRRRLGEFALPAPSFELTTLLNTAERSLQDDPARAAADFQHVLDAADQAPVRRNDGVWVSGAAFATTRLQAAAASVQAQWREQYSAAAASAVERLGASADPLAWARIAARWPLAPAAGISLSRAADAWAAQGNWELAQATALSAIHNFPDLAQVPLWARAAEAAAQLGNLAQVEKHLSSLSASAAKNPTPLTWRGKATDAAGLATALRELAQTHAPAASLPTLGGAMLHISTPTYATAISSDAAADAPLPRPSAVRCRDGLIIATPDAVAYFAADGALRWRHAAPAEVSTRAPGSERSLIAATVVCDGAVALAGLRQFNSRRLIAVAVNSGRLLWSSADIPELADATLFSEPTLVGNRVWAVFAAETRFVACLDAQTGAVMWRFTVGGRDVVQPLGGVSDWHPYGDDPAPLLLGDDVIVSTNAGSVLSLHAATGQLRWLSPYSRTTVYAPEARPTLRKIYARRRGRLLADADLIYVAPRDTLDLLALNRNDGTVAWSLPLSDANEIIAITPAGLLSRGPALTVHDPRTGTVLWRWQPETGEPGSPAIVGVQALVPTADRFAAIDLSTGVMTPSKTYAELGLSRAPQALCVQGDALLACSDGQVSWITAQKTAARTVAFPTDWVKPIPAPSPIPTDGAPVALATAWELPLGYIENLVQPADGDGNEAYVVANGRLNRLAADTGRIVWSVPKTDDRLRGLSISGNNILLFGEGCYTILDRATGAWRWQDTRDRDPALLRQWDEQWRVMVTLDGERVIRWKWQEDWFTLRDAKNGSELLRGRCEGGLLGCHIVGDDIHLVVARNGKLFVEVRSQKDGARSFEQKLDLDGDNSASVSTLDNGDMVIGNQIGGILWHTASREAVRFDLGMRYFHTVWHDGKYFTLVGVHSENWRHRAATITADGKLVLQDEFIQHNDPADRRGLSPRWVGDIRVRPAERDKQAGVYGQRANGDEAFWLPTNADWRRNYQALVPCGPYAVAFCNDRDAWLRAQLVDPQTGKLINELGLGATQAWRVLPITVGKQVLVGTTHGVIALVPSTQPAQKTPARAIGESHIPMWRVGHPIIIDGHLDEWADCAPIAVEPVDPAAMTVAAAWDSEAVQFAFKIPLRPDQAPRVTVALLSVRGDFNPGAGPLFIELDWHSGAPHVHVLNTDADTNRAPITARAIATPAGTQWEMQIPADWIDGGREMLQNDHWLRFAAVVETAGSENGGHGENDHGLRDLTGAFISGFDPTMMTRLRLLDRKP